MDIQKVDKIQIDGGNVTLNVPINIDADTAEKLVKLMTDEAVTSEAQNKIIIGLLQDIRSLLSRKR